MMTSAIGCWLQLLAGLHPARIEKYLRTPGQYWKAKEKKGGKKQINN